MDEVEVGNLLNFRRSLNGSAARHCGLLLRHLLLPGVATLARHEPYDSLLKSCAQRSVVPRRRVAAIVAGASLIAGSAAAAAPRDICGAYRHQLCRCKPWMRRTTRGLHNYQHYSGKYKTHGRSGQCHGRGFPEQQVDLRGRVTIISETRGLALADRAILEYRDGELAQVTATGSPAHFEQRRTDSQLPEHGQADEITYDAKQEPSASTAMRT